jgi:hypothetical protein
MIAGYTKNGKILALGPPPTKFFLNKNTEIFIKNFITEEIIKHSITDDIFIMSGEFNTISDYGKQISNKIFTF